MNWIWKIIDWRMYTGGFDVRRFCGAGNVNWWHKADIRKETAKLAKRGIPCYHVELFGWAGSAVYDQPDYIIERMCELVFWCKRRRLRLFISLTNDNQGQVKHGATDKRTLASFRTQITKVAQALRKVYWDGMYVQPVGETQTNAGYQIESECVALFPRAALVCNTGSRPRGVPAWASYAAYHAAHLTDKVPSGLWDVTDHGTALSELGGTGAQDYRDVQVESDARRAWANSNPYILYMFQQRVMSESDLDALARGYGR